MAMPHLMPQRQGPHKKIKRENVPFSKHVSKASSTNHRTFELGRRLVVSVCSLSSVFSDVSLRQTPTVVFLRNFTVKKTCLVNVYGKQAPWVP